MRILAVAGARPNFMKVAPLLHELARRPGVEARLVHTGQHYDRRMSEGSSRSWQSPARRRPRGRLRRPRRPDGRGDEAVRAGTPGPARMRSSLSAT
ncbi:MAG: hypothetical protein WKF75_00915 [Singulisphaera sp.]